MMANSETLEAAPSSETPPPPASQQLDFEQRLRRLEKMALDYEVLQGELSGFRKEMQDAMASVILETKSTRALLEETWKHQQEDATARARRDEAFMGIMQDIFGELTLQGRGRIATPPAAPSTDPLLETGEQDPAPSTPSSSSSSAT